jgi:hypothetical protein
VLFEVLFAKHSSDEENQETSVNAGMPEKKFVWHQHSSGSQLLQSGIGIPASGFSPV